MSVRVTYKPRGLVMAKPEEKNFEADSFEITEDGRVDLYREGGYVGEVQAGIWETVIVVPGEEG